MKCKSKILSVSRSHFSISFARRAKNSKRTGIKEYLSDNSLKNFVESAMIETLPSVRLECFAKRNVSRDTDDNNTKNGLLRKPNGFTLIEVLVAMAILAATVYVMSDLHIRTMFRLVREREQFLKLFLVKNALTQQLPLVRKDFKPSKGLLENEDAPNPVTLAVELVELNPKSPLNDILGDQLALVQATGTWKNGPFDYDIKLVSFGQREVWLEDPKP